MLSQIRSHTFQIDGGHKAFAAVLFLHLRPAVFVALDFFDLLLSDEVDKPFVFGQEILDSNETPSVLSSSLC